MKRSLLYIITALILGFALSNCKSKKVACPAYGGSSTPPGAIPKSSKTTSGVMPGDGRGIRTKLPR